MLTMRTLNMLLPLSLLASFFAAPSMAQNPLQTTLGGAHGGKFGTVVAISGDVNEDHYYDIAVGVPGDDSVDTDRGKVIVFSGKDGSVLFTVNGDAKGDRFGSSLCYIPDTNGDGCAELLVGAPYADPSGLVDAGTATLISGATGGILTVKEGFSAGDRYGSSVAYAGTNDAGTRYYVVGAPYRAHAHAGAGSVYLYYAPGTYMHEFYGSQGAEHFGASVSGFIDLNKDGVPDFVAGAPDYDDNGSAVGRVRAYSTASPFGLLHEVVGAGPGQRFGTTLATVGDINLDGFGDYAVGAPDYANGDGALYVISGENGGFIFTKFGTNGARLGASVSRAFDVNGDGKFDIIAGLPGDTTGGAFGTVKIYSGQGGSVLATINGTQSGAGFATSVAAGSDVNFDGARDIVVGSPTASNVAPNSGNVKCFSGQNYSQIYNLDGPVAGTEHGRAICSLGDVNNDGFVDYLVSAPKEDHTYYNFGILTTDDDAGAVRCISGANGSTLWTSYGSSDGDAYGSSICNIGDVNGDNINDFLAGAPQTKTLTLRPGYAKICSGANGSVMFTLNGLENGEEFGASVALAGDVIGDGGAYVAIGAPGYNNNRGRFHVFNAATGVIIQMPMGYNAGQRFGTCVAGGGDQGNDGRNDIFAGAPSDDSAGTNAGRVYCLSVSAGATVLFTIDGAKSNHQFGTSIVSINDIDGDGKREVAVGGPGYSTIVASGLGSVQLFNSGSHAPAWSVFGAENDHLGTSLDRMSDYTNDGFDEIIAAASPMTSQFTPGVGYVTILNGFFGGRHVKISGSLATDGFGSCAAAVGDINHDGIADVAVGAPLADGLSNNSGAAIVYSVAPQGIVNYGTSTPGCYGSQTLKINTTPRVGTPSLQFGVDWVPAYSLGLLLVTDSQDAAGSDPFGLGINMYVDLFQATELFAIDIYGMFQYHGLAETAIPNNPLLANHNYFAQTLWLWNECALPPENLSASTAMQLTIQP